MWIIPAWPIASLSIDRLVRLLTGWTRIPGSNGFRSGTDKAAATHKQAPKRSRWIVFLYWVVFLGFFGLMLSFVWPSVDRSLTRMAILLVGFLIMTPTNHRLAILTFLAGSGLGVFLEYWGTTRECWTYYTLARPPLFAVLAHGMAAVAFWRTSLVLQIFFRKLFPRPKAPPKGSATLQSGGARTQ
jgi:hypothetical protein